MELTALICSNCGSPLTKDGDIYRCPHCLNVYEKEKADRSAETLSSLLEADRIEKLANARKLLYDATHADGRIAKFPVRDAVVNASRAALSVNQDEPMAELYLHSYDADPCQLIRLLPSLNLEPCLARDAFDWLLPMLSSRLVGPLNDFACRHFAGKERTERLTAIEDMADGIDGGTYVHTLPRDVFLAYSSADMPRVVEVLDLLEENGLTVFAAFRNLRHGKGAAENYLNAVKEAMSACSAFVFLSSESSRQMACDAMKVELPYLVNHFPGKPRVEYLLDDYSPRMAFMVRNTLKKAFPEQEHCRDAEDLVERLYAFLDSAQQAQPKAGAEKKAREDYEEQTRLEAEARKKKEEERLGIRPAISYDGKTLTYGLYPQKRVSDPVLLSALNRLGDDAEDPKTGWYLYAGEYYAKQVAKPYGIGYTFDDGTAIVKNKAYWFKCEPIRWRVLSNNGHYYVISHVLLDAHRYAASSNDYANSEIRSWLNGDFYNSAFTLGSDFIQTTTVDNSGATTGSSSNPNACANTTDKVFLPSYKDYVNPAYGFSASTGSSASRECKTTDYARARGALYGRDPYLYNSWYRTRSPSSSFSYNAWCVGSDGYLYDSGVDNANYGVRPGLALVVPE